jgi:excisionase family DNA binding protein
MDLNQIKLEFANILNESIKRNIEPLIESLSLILDKDKTQPCDYLSIKEAANYIGVSSNTVRNWIKDGYIESFQNRYRGIIRVKKTDLIQLKKKNKRDNFFPRG